MKKFCPALFLTYAVVHLACPRATAATMYCGQRVASFALFGTNDLSILSALPPQVVP